MFQKYMPVYILADSSINAFEMAAIKRSAKECAQAFGFCVFLCLYQKKWGNGRYCSADDIICAARKEDGRIITSSALSIMGKSACSFRHPGAIMLFTKNDLKVGATWGFGSACVDNMCSILSTCRYNGLSDGDFVRCVTRTMRHELGHLFQCAADKDRSHTIEKYGIHCTNSGCSMRQTLNINELLDAATMEDPKHCFCMQCREDMRRFRLRYEENHEMVTLAELSEL